MEADTLARKGSETRCHDLRTPDMIAELLLALFRKDSGPWTHDRLARRINAGQRKTEIALRALKKSRLVVTKEGNEFFYKEKI